MEPEGDYSRTSQLLDKSFNLTYSTNVNTMGSQSVHSIW